MVVNKIMIKNTTTGQYDSADIGASAENISFDPTGSNLESTDTESAIKETYGAIPANTSQLINDSNFVVSSSLAEVATSGDYEDLSNTPSLATVATSGNYSDLSNKPVLATVATSGSYNDLSNTPTIPSIEANPSDTATNTLTKLEVDGTVYNITSGGGGSSTLSGLSDVNLTSPSDGQVLKYDATNQEWINGTGGSGSGGHTIIDDNGDALTQRDEMQFVGTYSEDDSTNEITKVNIVREMTKAEFDLLSDDEKTGIIVTTDEETYSGQYGETILLSTPTSLGSGTSITLSDDYTNYDAIYIDFEPVDSSLSVYRNCVIRLISDISLNTTYVGYSIYDNGNFGFIYELTNSNTFYGQAISPSSRDMKINKIVGIKFGGASSGSNEIYSTDERAVGTWIDGSTIYQKTFELTTAVIVNNSNWTSTEISKGDINKIISCEGMTSDGTCWGDLCATPNVDSYINLLTARNGDTESVKWFTIKYTKSTT